MSSRFADRLRGIVSGRQPAAAGPAHPWDARGDDGERDVAGRCVEPASGGRGDPADALGGGWMDSHGHRYIVVERTYAPGHRHGRTALMDSLPPWPRLPLLGGAEDGRLLFIDLETTGLAGGAGTYAFLIGCGWFDGPFFRIRQYFLSGHAGEPAMLAGVAQLAGGVAGVVSFNGKSFDLPLIETRYQFHRTATPFSGLPHIDMLHPSRRLWRETDGDGGDGTAECRLTRLEEAVCGVTRERDVPACEIPARYFHYVRSGDARPLEPVLEHNRLDLLSLALLTARAARLLDDGPLAARTAREALGMGGLYERAGLVEHAGVAYARAAADLPADAPTRAEALRCHAVLCRRQRRFAEAADAWRRLLELRRCPPRLAREATEALAVHHEHRLRDPRAARQLALQTLGYSLSPSREHAVHHRLARLERKIAGPITQRLGF